MTDTFDDEDDFLTRPLRPDQFDFPKYVAKIQELRQKELKKKLCEKYLEMDRQEDTKLTSTPRPGTPNPFFEVSPITNTDSGTVSDYEDYKDASDLFSDEAVELIIKSPKFKEKIARLDGASKPSSTSLIYHPSS